jgi:hypothetical protein
LSILAIIPVLPALWLMILKITLNFIFLAHLLCFSIPISCNDCVCPYFFERPSSTHHALCAFFAPTSGAIHKWIASPCNLFLTLYLSCVFVPFSYALNYSYPPPSAWFHLAPRWLPTRFPSTMGIKLEGGFGTLFWHHPIPIRM